MFTIKEGIDDDGIEGTASLPAFRCWSEYNDLLSQLYQ